MKAATKDSATDDPAVSPAGRFAPSPTGELHLGNLRTALVAWLFARSTGRRFVLRIEDLDRDRVRRGSAEQQLADLAALGLDWDGDVWHQSERLGVYQAALDELSAAGLAYECYCSRKDIAQAASAPQDDAAQPGTHTPAPPRAYPGTCRDLTDSERAARRSEGRAAAIRLRAGTTSWEVTELVAHGGGVVTGTVDDVVLRRKDGAYAYNLAVVVDDAAQGIDQVVRGDDLLSSAPRQAYLAHLLGLAPVAYAHVPLALGPTGQRLAKRDGAVTMADLATRGVGPDEVLGMLAGSLGLAEAGERITVRALLERFDAAALPREAWRVAGQ